MNLIFPDPGHTTADANTTASWTWAPGDVDPFLGMWVWWDEAPTAAQREACRGQIVARSPVSAHYLVRWRPGQHVPDGVHEVVSVDRMALECWALFETEDALDKAVKTRGA